MYTHLADIRERASLGSGRGDNDVVAACDCHRVSKHLPAVR